MRLFIAVAARGVPVEFLLFREEGHELLRLRNKQAFVERTVQWLAKWLAPGAARERELGALASAGGADGVPLSALREPVLPEVGLSAVGGNAPEPARGARAVHAIGAEGTPERTIQQRAITQVHYATRAAGK